jgi:hypothetical protein
MPTARTIWRLAEEIESLTNGDYSGRARFQGNFFVFVLGR